MPQVPTSKIRNLTFVRVERASISTYWYTDRIGEVFAVEGNSDGGFTVLEDEWNLGSFLIDRGDCVVVEPVVVVGRPGSGAGSSREYWCEVGACVGKPWRDKEAGKSDETRLDDADRLQMLEDKFEVTVRSLARRIAQLEERGA
jgi:hypothetical protein